MEYKDIIKRYKTYNKGYVKRCETVFKSFAKDVPEPSDEVRQKVYDANKHELVGRVQEEIDLICALSYVSGAYEDMLRNNLKE